MDIYDLFKSNQTHLNNQVPGEDLPRPRSASFNISRNKRRTYSHVSGLMFITEIFKIINRLLQTLQAELHNVTDMTDISV